MKREVTVFYCDRNQHEQQVTLTGEERYGFLRLVYIAVEEMHLSSWEYCVNGEKQAFGEFQEHFTTGDKLVLTLDTTATGNVTLNSEINWYFDLSVAA